MTRLIHALTQLTEAEFAAFITCAAVCIGLALVPLAIVLMEMI